jgi:hypothetical protein
MMAAHSSLDDVRNWPIFPRLSPVGLAYGLGKVATNDPISRSTSSCFDANMYKHLDETAVSDRATLEGLTQFPRHRRCARP